MVENIVGIAEKRGYPYRRQVKGMLRYAQNVLLDESGAGA